MDDRSISEAVRHLEDLRSAGYITAEQFRDEVRDLLAGLDAASLRDGHAVPDQADAPGDDQDWSLDSEISDTPLILDTPPDPDPPLPDEEPRLQRPSVPHPGGPRVVVKGSVPWEGRERTKSLGVERVENIRSGQGPQPEHKELHHRQLAGMASKDIVRLQRKRDPRRVALASVLVPGLGHFMLDRPGPGAAFALIWTVGLVFILGFAEWDALYVLVPTILLAAAHAHKLAMLHNYHLERRRLMDLKKAQAREAKLDVERSVREGEWERMGLDTPKR